MKLYSLVLDNFLARPREARDQLLKLPFKEVVSEFDGVAYPDICRDLPQILCEEFQAKIAILIGSIDPVIIFARLSTLGNNAPHQAHTDARMGQFTAIIYMNLPHQCLGGTSILEHKEGMVTQPTTDQGIQLLDRDCNISQKWNIVGGSQMKFNRMFLVASELFHRSEPIGGFGKDLNDGRLVLTMFFNMRSKNGAKNN